jgi:hypothetical protein
MLSYQNKGGGSKIALYAECKCQQSEQTHVICLAKEYHNKLNTQATNTMFSFNELNIYTGKSNMLINHLKITLAKKVL